jgi:hypothetical protein
MLPKVRAGLMSAVVALGVLLSSEVLADLTAKEAAKLDAEGKPL